MKRIQGVPLIVAAGILLSACGQAARTASDSHTTRVIHIDTSRTKEYQSLPSLAADSQAVVLATVESQKVVNIHGIPFTDSRLKLEKAISSSTPKTFTLRQTGQKGSSPDLPVADVGQTYLLFLKQYETTSGNVPNTFVCVGGPAGAYRAETSSSFVKTDPLSPELPVKLSISELSTALR